MAKFKYQELEAMFEVDLTPVLALMVTLVPILLLTSVFVHTSIITTELPQAVKDAIAQNDKEQQTAIELKMDQENGFIVRIREGEKTETLNVPCQNKKWDWLALHKQLLDVKRRYPNHFSLEIYPGSDVSYQDIISVMDHARKANKDEEQFEVKDPKTGDIYKTELMFPDVVFANVLEG